MKNKLPLLHDCFLKTRSTDKKLKVIPGKKMISFPHEIVHKSLETVTNPVFPVITRGGIPVLIFDSNRFIGTGNDAIHLLKKK